MINRWFCLLFLVAASSIAHSLDGCFNSLTVNLKTSGSGSTFELNLLETISAYNELFYLPTLLKLFGDDDDNEFDADDFNLDQELYNEILNSLNLNDFDRENINFDFKYNIHTPRIQAHYDHYRSIEKDYNLQELTDSFGKSVSNDGIVNNWVLYNDQIYASVDDLYAMKTDSRSNAKTTEFDRVIGDSGPLLIFYGNHKSADFKLFFMNLFEAAKIGKLRFVWRYIPSSLTPESLSGYGVDLTLKNSGQLVINDDEWSEKNQHPRFDLLKDIDNIDQLKDIYPVKKTWLNNLGVKLSALVLSEQFTDSFKRLSFLEKIINNFPKFACFIADLNIDINRVKHYVSNNENIGLSKESYGIYVNGSPIHKLQLDFLKLISKIREEARIIFSLEKFGFNSKQAKVLLEKFAMISAYKQTQFRNGNTIMGKNENRFKFFEFNFSETKDHGVVFLNDIQNDQTYSEYTSNPDQAYLELNLKPNQIPPLRENIHDIIFAINMTDKAQLRVFFTLSKIILDNGIPQQVGILPIAETEFDRLIAKKFYFIVETSSQKEALGFLYKYLQSENEEDLKSLFDKIDVDNYDFDEKIYIDTLSRFDLKQASVIVNGVIFDLSSPDWQISMSKQIAQDIKLLKQYLKSEETNRKLLKDILYTNAKTLRDTRIIPMDPVDAIYKSIDQELIDSSILLKKSSGLKGTFWLFGDLNKSNVKLQLINLLRVMKSSDFQIRILNTGRTDELIDQINAFELNKLSNSKIDMIVTILQSSQNSSGDFNQTMIKLLDEKKLPVHHSFVLYNSRYVRVDTPLKNAEIQSLMEYEDSQRLSIIKDLIKAYDEIFDGKSVEIFTKNDASSYDLFTSIITKSFYTDDKLFITDVARFDFSKVDFTTSFNIGDGDLVDILVILDPIDENSQKIISMVNVVKDIPYLNIKILLHPKLEVENLNIKRFYQSSFMQTGFDNDGRRVFNTDVMFTNIPSKEIYTMELDVPNNWITTPKYTSNADLENLAFNEEEHVIAVYQLDYFLIEGYSKDVGLGASPSSASFELRNGDFQTESSLMSAMGYLQLHTKPGVSNISLEAKTSKYYNLLSATDNRFAANTEPIDSETIIIFDLYSKTIYPRLSVKNDEKHNSILNDHSSSKVHPDINIFAIASGQLYERLLAIMFLSVRNTTTSSIKFWIIENYLSVTFKQTLPQLAKKYDFEYEFITYKWPNFLRKQRDKQRSIWGYKMLFLDLIFPRSLERVIFVDADQVVLSDMKELMDIDLEGAPYGFVPMCDDREDMEGYRFWKTGYWAQVLGDDLKYHISALFVVDLNRFHELKVGERLRSQYQKLSVDASSLSNLDQDLPNNLQRVVPIFSLPQNWLWCETWCSEQTKAKAKAIDLCNDPVTKENKLDRAKRTIPNWQEYDQVYMEMKNLSDTDCFITREMYEQMGNIQSNDQLDDQLDDDYTNDEIEHDEL